MEHEVAQVTSRRMCCHLFSYKRMLTGKSSFTTVQIILLREFYMGFGLFKMFNLKGSPFL